MHVARSAYPLAGLAVLLFGCRDSLAVSPADVAGIYDLRSVTGTVGMRETPVSGRITLTVTRIAERRVTYQIDTTGTLREFIARGTYRLTDSVVDLALREDDGRSTYVWRVVAEREPDGDLRLTYPRPADGTIVEVYVRR
jgi:hypothetical protein